MRRMTLGAMGAGVAMAVGCGMSPVPSETARLRVVHASPDAPAVDVCADGSVVFAGAAFPGATAYTAVPGATYAVRVVSAGAGCSHPGVIAAALPLTAGTDTTVVAVNVLDAIEPLVLSDDNTVPASGNAKVRFVHASPDAPTVDITLADGTTLFDNIPFKGVGSYIEVPGGTYDLQVRDASGTTVVLPVNDVALAAGRIYTIYAVGLAGGNPALNAFVTTDN